MHLMCCMNYILKNNNKEDSVQMIKQDLLGKYTSLSCDKYDSLLVKKITKLDLPVLPKEKLHDARKC